MRTMKVLGLALVGTFALAKLGFADGDHQAKWEEMKKQHEECLKKAGFDQPTIDALNECHKPMHKKGGDGGNKDDWKAAVDSCLAGKNITLTDAQKDSMKACHGGDHHHHKDKDKGGDGTGGTGGTTGGD